MTWYTWAMVKKIYFIFIGMLMCVSGTVYVYGQNETVVPAPNNTPTESSVSTGEEYQLLSDIPGLGAVPTDGDFSLFLNAIYKMAIGIGSGLAVLMIVWVGIQYSMSAVATAKDEMRERLSFIIGGLILLLSAFVLLNFINPRLTDFSNKGDNFTRLNFDGVVGFLGIDTIDFEADENYLLFVPNPEEYPEIWVFQSTGTYGQMFATQEECEEAAAIGGETCTTTANPSLVAPSVVDPSVNTGELIIMAANDQRMDSIIPYNPSRTFRDFASHGNGTLKIARSVILHDAYFQAMFLTRFGHGLRLISAYRDPVHNRNVGSTANNHQLGYSLDYGTRELTRDERFFFQELIQATGAVRVGWGSTSAGTHVQWDDGVNTPYVYWCYPGSPGPFKGPGSMPGFAKGRSCSH